MLLKESITTNAERNIKAWCVGPPLQPIPIPGSPPKHLNERKCMVAEAVPDSNEKSVTKNNQNLRDLNTSDKDALRETTWEFQKL